MKAFALFFLKKVFWDFYDHIFVILFLNFLYTVPLVIFYGLLLAFFNQANMVFLLAALFYAVIISPIFMPLVGYVQKITRLEDPALTDFWALFRDIPWKRCYLVYFFFFGITVVYAFNIWFYFLQLREYPFFVGIIILFFFVGLILIAWYGMSLIHFYENRFSFDRFKTLVAVTIEYWTFLFPWMLTWLVVAFVSFLIVLPLIVFFPTLFLLFMATFNHLAGKNYDIKADVIKRVKTRKEMIRQYHHSLREYYERYADQDENYQRSFKDLIRPWRH